MAQGSQKPTPLETQIDQLLTEARVIIPGVQAMLGFQLTITFTQAFAGLEPATKIVHASALCFMGLAVILLMAPASIHRIAFSGQDDPTFPQDRISLRRSRALTPCARHRARHLCRGETCFAVG